MIRTDNQVKGEEAKENGEQVKQDDDEHTVAKPEARQDDEMEVKKELDAEESEMKLAKTMDSDEDYKFMNKSSIDSIDILY